MTAGREIKVIETALRDGQQCLWATRMSTAMMLPIAERLDQAGFHAIDMMGSIQFDVCVRYLKENPWDRLRLMRRRIRQTPLKGGLRSKSLVTFRVLPDDVVHLWVRLLVKHGIRKLSVFDALFDLDNVVDTMKVAQAEGADVGAALVFCESPVHTDDLYVSKTKELIERVGITHVMLKDSGGLLTPERVRALVPKLKAAMGGIPLELHTHCMTGLGPLVYLAGVEAGADVVQTATAPLANGASQPATQTIIRNLRQSGYRVDVDDTVVNEFSDYLARVAAREGKPVGMAMAYDAYHFEHQIPGGMLTNLEAQLRDVGLLGRYDDVVRESVRVRNELGYPIMVTPFAQLVVTQAVYNVITGERYRIVPDEVKQYALGYFGKLLAPVAPDAMDRIVENGAKAIALEPEPPPPAVADLRRLHPRMSDEERLLRFMFLGQQVDDMLAAGPVRTDYDPAAPPIAELIRAAASRNNVGSLSIRTGSYAVELNRSAAKP
jgi:oxaloacetate decarboxylase alpha subunit